MAIYTDKLEFDYHGYNILCDCVVDEDGRQTQGFRDELGSQALDKIVLEFFAGLGANVKDLSAAGYKALRKSIVCKFVGNTTAERICALSKVLHCESVRRRYFDTEKETWDSVLLLEQNSVLIKVSNKKSFIIPFIMDAGAEATIGYNNCHVIYNQSNAPAATAAPAALAELFFGPAMALPSTSAAAAPLASATAQPSTAAAASPAAVSQTATTVRPLPSTAATPKK